MDSEVACESVLNGKLELGIDALLADEDTTLSPRLRQLVAELRAEWRELDTRVEALNGEFVELARNDAAARRLTSIPGVGVLNATALIAAVGDASSFAKARDLGAWLGLVPRQHTTGGKPRLLGSVPHVDQRIVRRGDGEEGREELHRLLARLKLAGEKHFSIVRHDAVVGFFGLDLA